MIIYPLLILFFQERSQAYERVLREKSRVIQDTEIRSMNRKERSMCLYYINYGSGL